MHFAWKCNVSTVSGKHFISTKPPTQRAADAETTLQTNFEPGSKIHIIIQTILMVFLLLCIGLRICLFLNLFYFKSQYGMFNLQWSSTCSTALSSVSLTPLKLHNLTFSWISIIFFQARSASATCCPRFSRHHHPFLNPPPTLHPFFVKDFNIFSL